MPYSDPDRQRAYQREWVARRQAEWLADKVCIDCGSSDDLTIDHGDPEKKLTHRIWSWKPERREVELAKCDVRCEDCHKKRTAIQTMRHGMSRWRDGCRCDTCVSTAKATFARWRKNKRAKLADRSALV